MQFLGETNINFLKWRPHAFALSALIIIGGLVTIMTRGMPLGVDFTGGTAIKVYFAEPVDAEAVRTALAPMPGEKVVQLLAPTPGSPENEVLIRLPPTVEVEQGENISAAADQARELLRNAPGLPAFTPGSTESVGPVIGAELQRKGIYATFTALAGILIYVGFRFRFTFAVGAIAAVFHDILVTLAFLTWFNFELSLNVVAAILTITGYSVNDTIVIFDRVRENQRTAKREPVDTLVNRSVNQTLSRTIITSGTTLLAVVSLFVLGGEVLRSFSFTMIVGILTGTYSTVFIASALAIVLTRSGQKTPATQAQARSRAKRSA